MPAQIVQKCSNALSALGLTLAFAESATGGRFSAEFSLTKKAGRVLKGGVVCYDADSKRSLLNVSDKLINIYSQESAEVTKAMAFGLKGVIDADVYLAVTGLTKAGSENQEKPVGTVFVCGLFRELQFAESFVFAGEQEEVVLSSVAWSSKLILDHVVKPLKKVNKEGQTARRSANRVKNLVQPIIPVIILPPA